jgi:tetratricopeptide (TPR) repeat protein
MASEVIDESLRNYIERVTALQRERERALTLKDLQEVARDLGMSDDDLAAAERAERTYLQRGLGHYRFKLWDEAVEDLTSAVALNPADVEALHGLALAYEGRWRARGDEKDFAAAERVAKQALQIDPNYTPSFMLLSELHQSTATNLVPSDRRRLAIIVAIVVVLLLIIFTLMIFGARTNTTQIRL